MSNNSTTEAWEREMDTPSMNTEMRGWEELPPPSLVTPRMT